MTAHDRFPTRTAGLAEVTGPQIVRMADGDRYSLSSGPVCKTPHGNPDAELRMRAYNARGLRSRCPASLAAAPAGTPTNRRGDPR